MQLAALSRVRALAATGEVAAGCRRRVLWPCCFVEQRVERNLLA